MAAPRIMNGARAKFGFIDPATGTATICGIFSNVSYGLSFDAQPAFILGRYSAAEIDYVAAEPVRVTATGWRVIHHGPHTEAHLPRLQDLLKHEYLTLVIFDRQTNLPVATIRSVRPISYDTTIANRNLEEITITFMGLLVDDEDNSNSESVGATDLP